MNTSLHFDVMHWLKLINPNTFSSSLKLTGIQVLISSFMTTWWLKSLTASREATSTSTLKVRFQARWLTNGGRNFLRMKLTKSKKLVGVQLECMKIFQCCDYKLIFWNNQSKNKIVNQLLQLIVKSMPYLFHQWIINNLDFKLYDKTHIWLNIITTNYQITLPTVDLQLLVRIIPSPQTNRLIIYWLSRISYTKFSSKQFEPNIDPWHRYKKLFSFKKYQFSC